MSRGVSIRFCAGDSEHGRQCMRAATERVRPVGGYVEHLCPACAIKWHEAEVTRIRGELAPVQREPVRDYWTVRDQNDKGSNRWPNRESACEWMRGARRYPSAWAMPLRLVHVTVTRKVTP